MYCRFSTLICLLFLATIPCLQAQESEQPKLVIKPTLAMQLWSTFTDGQQLFNTDIEQFEPVDNRLNFSLHRTRAGIKGSYGDRWIYDFTTSLDFVGQDVFCLLYTSPSPRDATLSRMPSSA